MSSKISHGRKLKMHRGNMTGETVATFVCVNVKLVIEMRVNPWFCDSVKLACGSLLYSGLQNRRVWLAARQSSHMF